MPPAVHLDKQVATACFLNSFWSSPCGNNFFYEERREFDLVNLQRFNNNESEEVCGFDAVYFSKALRCTTHHQVKRFLRMS